jgi:hypothetical protein
MRPSLNRMFVGFTSQKQMRDLTVFSSRNHELCHPLLNGLKAGAGFNSILEQQIKSTPEQHRTRFDFLCMMKCGGIAPCCW